ncbi:MAG: glycosyltransferase family 9 protein [Chlorobi bacterium]|nr:MAG: family 9 glycosyl transferase [Chlorobi bacterium OLB7]MBK8909973.1 glycosyltransferase family 9 protein [Chlorobiota bacterium]
MNLLVIRFSSAGDILLTSLFLRSLRKRFPDASIHFLTKQEFLPLVAHSPYLDRVITINSSDRRKELSQRKRTLIRELGGKYDVAYDLHNSLRSRWFRVGIAQRVEVIRKPSLRKRLLVWFKWNRLRPIVPIPELYLRVGSRDGLANDGQGLELFIGETSNPLPPLRGKPTVGFAPGARHQTKRWPPERWIALGAMLREHHQARIVLLGAPEESHLCQLIADGISNGISGGIDGDSHAETSPLNLAGETTWLQTAAALDGCDLVVTNDSAIAHLAAARKRTVVAIFGPTVQEFGFAPYGTRMAVAEVPDLPCRPCTTIGGDRCPKGHFRCMIGLQPHHVAEIIEKLKAMAG